MEKKAELYRGKAKTVYATDDPEKLIIFFRNDTSAFDGLKIQQFNNKMISKNITSLPNKKVSYINMIPKKQNIIKNVYKNYTGYLSTKMKTN